MGQRPVNCWDACLPKHWLFGLVCPETLLCGNTRPENCKPKLIQRILVLWETLCLDRDNDPDFPGRRRAEGRGADLAALGTLILLLPALFLPTCFACGVLFQSSLNSVTLVNYLRTNSGYSFSCITRATSSLQKIPYVVPYQLRKFRLLTKKKKYVTILESMFMIKLDPHLLSDSASSATSVR